MGGVRLQLQKFKSSIILNFKRDIAKVIKATIVK
jgi:hypothetical protein